MAQYHAEVSLGQKLDQNAGWFGFARLTEPLPVTFFALSSNGQRVCALGGVGNVKYFIHSPPLLHAAFSDEAPANPACDIT